MANCTSLGSSTLLLPQLEHFCVHAEVGCASWWRLRTCYAPRLQQPHPPCQPACTQVEVDFTPFMTIASMLYGTSFVAERFSGIRTFLEADGTQAAAVKAAGGSQSAVQAAALGDERVLLVTRHIIAGAGAPALQALPSATQVGRRPA